MGKKWMKTADWLLDERNAALKKVDELEKYREELLAECNRIDVLRQESVDAHTADLKVLQQVRDAAVKREGELAEEKRARAEAEERSEHWYKMHEDLAHRLRVVADPTDDLHLNPDGSLKLLSARLAAAGDGEKISEALREELVFAKETLEGLLREMNL